MMKGNNKILYLGLDPKNFGKEVFHFPIIEIKPFAFEKIIPFFSSHRKWTHIILTSQVALKIFFETCEKLDVFLEDKIFLLVGKATEQKLQLRGSFKYFVAEQETGEGVNSLMKEPGYFFYPHSIKSRSVITDFLKNKGYDFVSCPLYDTVAVSTKSLPSLEQFDEIVFTSSSCVEAFIELYHVLPRQKKLTAIGPITQKKLDCFLKVPYCDGKN